MIILEGPDLVGKTTAAKMLTDRLPRHLYSHLGKLPPAFDQFHDYDAISSTYQVCDRFHMSEVVYGSVCRGESKLNAETYRLVEAMLAMKGAFTVLMVFEDREVLEERFERLSDREAFSLEQIWQVNNLYHEILENDVRDGLDHYDFHYDAAFLVTKEYPEPVAGQWAKVLDAYADRLENLFSL